MGVTINTKPKVIIKKYVPDAPPSLPVTNTKGMQKGNYKQTRTRIQKRAVKIKTCPKEVCKVGGGEWEGEDEGGEQAKKEKTEEEEEAPRANDFIRNDRKTRAGSIFSVVECIDDPPHKEATVARNPSSVFGVCCRNAAPSKREVDTGDPDKLTPILQNPGSIFGNPWPETDKLDAVAVDVTSSEWKSSISKEDGVFEKEVMHFHQMVEGGREELRELLEGGMMMNSDNTRDDDHEQKEKEKEKVKYGKEDIVLHREQYVLPRTTVQTLDSAHRRLLSSRTGAVIAPEGTCMLQQWRRYLGRVRGGQGSMCSSLGELVERQRKRSLGWRKKERDNEGREEDDEQFVLKNMEK
eukprot:Nk52_evm1s2339 gene=Nk52_evmTU1s2339